MSNATPKPGPHLSPSTSHCPPYRELAKHHADLARNILDGLDGMSIDDATDAATIAQAHALTSLAYTEMAPPARYRKPADHNRAGVAR